MKKLTSVLLVVMALIMVLPSVVSAAPYKTYTYSKEGEILISPDAYEPDLYVDSEYIGLDEEMPFDDPGDLFVGPDEKVYIADTANNRILVLTRYYKLDFEITSFVNDYGVPDTFSSPKGVFVNEKNIYVCDTDNNRLVLFDTEGNFIKIIEQPESSLFEEGAIYKPIACAVDQYGRIFVVSSTTYQGVIVLNDESEFFGFIGAQTDTLSALQKFWRRFQTKEQRAQQKENTSKELNNITIDKDNFIYVTTSALEDADLQAQVTSKDKTTSPVKKLNASGADVMKRNGDFAPSGEARFALLPTSKIQGASKLVDVGIGPVGTWSIIDEKRSKVYTYDENGNLLFAFGDTGEQTGNIGKIAAVAYQGDKMILLDANNDSFVVYRRTKYGDLLIGALQNDADRKFDLATEDWTKILTRNINYSIAYLQLGKAAARNGEYDTAMDYYKRISNTTDYSKAFSEVRTKWANKWFWTVPLVVIAACLLIGKFFGYAGKVNKRASLKIGRKSLKEEILFAFHVIFHPFDGFWDLKHEKRGSVKSAFVILLATIVAFFYRSIGTGYIHNTSTSSYMNILANISAVVVPLALWIISNWCLTTLFDGEGSMKDIFVASCYSLTPLPIIMIPTVLLSNGRLEPEAEILGLFYGVALAWTGLLLFFAMMVTHDYSLGKNILTCLATIVGMAFIMFIAILFSTLMGKIVGFISDIAIELNYRV
ncbi:MAG: YIP1 family protein [Clostridia bacterium]|nr:YIP1 family protein [Clostridia bacterium]